MEEDANQLHRRPQMTEQPGDERDEVVVKIAPYASVSKQNLSYFGHIKKGWKGKGDNDIHEARE